MTIELLYGKGTLPVRVPGNCRPVVIEKHKMPLLEAPERAIAEALEKVLTGPAQQNAAMDKTMELLGKGQDAPGLRAARAILNRTSA